MATAPRLRPDGRTDPPDAGPERDVLGGVLDFLRGTVVLKASGLSEAQARAAQARQEQLAAERQLQEAEHRRSEADHLGRKADEIDPDVGRDTGRHGRGDDSHVDTSHGDVRREESHGDVRRDDVRDDVRDDRR